MLYPYGTQRTMLLRVILLSCVLCAVVAQNTSYVLLKSLYQNTCSESQWRCADGGCIPKEGKCNAVVECKDASDEYLDTCRGVDRSVVTLQLLCLLLWDKSQPICPQICYQQPAFCHYALTSEIGQPNTCRFPKYPAHGKYTVQPLPTRQADGFRLHYTCDQSYALVETEKMDCVNGAWVNEDKPRYCTEACRLYKSDNFTYACEGNACGNHVPVGTVVTVTRKDTGPGVPVSVQILCKEDKTFNLTTDCIADIDNLQQQFENPTMVKMTEYESKFNQMKTNDSNETSYEFQSLVDQFHLFEDQVRGNLTMMNRKSEECDMYLDLLLYNLSMNQKLF